MTIGELRRTPAVDRAADELLRADEEAETDEDDDSVLSTQPVDVVIVHAKLQLADAQYRLEQAIHRVDQTYDGSDDNKSTAKLDAYQKPLRFLQTFNKPVDLYNKETEYVRNDV